MSFLVIVNPSPFNPPQVQCLTHAWTSTPSYAEFYDTFTGGCPRRESSRTDPNSARHSILTEPRRAHARVHLQTTQRWAIEIVTKCEHCEDFRCRSSKSPEEACARDVLGYLICRYRMASMWRPSRRTLGGVVDGLAKRKADLVYPTTGPGDIRLFSKASLWANRAPERAPRRRCR